MYMAASHFKRHAQGDKPPQTKTKQTTHICFDLSMIFFSFLPKCSNFLPLLASPKHLKTHFWRKCLNLLPLRATQKLKNNKNAAMLFYDKDEKIQVRLKVECIVNHKNEITIESWSKTQHISRKCYLVDNGPGTESNIPTSGLKPELDNFDYTKEQSEDGYKNFTVIQCKIKSVEWLYLAAKGHRRARFDLENNKDNWLIP